MEKWDLYDENGVKIDKFAYRGQDLEPGDYHLVVSSFIKNSKNEYLISRRSENKIGGGLLETVGGAALEGEDSKTAMLREIREEIGLSLTENELRFIKRLKFETKNAFFFDVWFVEKEVELEQLKLQTEEVQEVMWIAKERVEELIEEESFFNAHIYKELKEHLTNMEDNHNV